jgi:hypothetical protein
MELELVPWEPEGRWFKPRLLLEKCRGVPEPDTEPLAPDDPAVPCISDPAVADKCVHEWVNARQ